MDYDFETSRIVFEIKKRDAKIVALQFPEGFKTRSIDIAKEIEEKSGAKCLIFADPCYGACDTRETDAKKLGADLLVHFGHDVF